MLESQINEIQRASDYVKMLCDSMGLDGCEVEEFRFRQVIGGERLEVFLSCDMNHRDPEYPANVMLYDDPDITASFNGGYRSMGHESETWVIRVGGFRIVRVQFSFQSISGGEL